jgi:hypothetical protein
MHRSLTSPFLSCFVAVVGLCSGESIVFWCNALELPFQAGLGVDGNQLGEIPLDELDVGGLQGGIPHPRPNPNRAKRHVPNRSRCNTDCTSDECQELASNILERMNSSADPCDQFYEFSCSAEFRNSVELPPFYGKYGHWERIGLEYYDIYPQVMNCED